jgi:hypothetical protein
MKQITTLSEAGKKGAAITNKILTTEGRRKAALKGWKLLKHRLLADATFPSRKKKSLPSPLDK